MLLSAYNEQHTERLKLKTWPKNMPVNNGLGRNQNGPVRAKNTGTSTALLMIFITKLFLQLCAADFQWYNAHLEYYISNV